MHRRLDGLRAPVLHFDSSDYLSVRDGRALRPEVVGQLDIRHFTYQFIFSASSGGMTAKVRKDVLQRVEAWPEEAQEELASIAREIDAQLTGGVYHATPEELEALDDAERSGVGIGALAMNARPKEF